MGLLSSYKLPHARGQGKENVGTTNMLPGKIAQTKKHTKKHGTTHILLLANAFLLTFHFLQQCCLSSHWQRNLIYIKELTFEN